MDIQTIFEIFHPNTYEQNPLPRRTNFDARPQKIFHESTPGDRIDYGDFARSRAGAGIRDHGSGRRGRL